jgi:hypothetical protein
VKVDDFVPPPAHRRIPAGSATQIVAGGLVASYQRLVRCILQDRPRPIEKGGRTYDGCESPWRCCGARAFA